MEGSSNGLFCGTIQHLFGMAEENRKEHLSKWSLQGLNSFLLSSALLVGQRLFL